MKRTQALDAIYVLDALGYPAIALAMEAPVIFFG